MRTCGRGLQERIQTQKRTDNKSCSNQGVAWVHIFTAGGESKTKNAHLVAQRRLRQRPASPSRWLSATLLGTQRENAAHVRPSSNLLPIPTISTRCAYHRASDANAATNFSAPMSWPVGTNGSTHKPLAACLPGCRRNCRCCPNRRSLPPVLRP